MSTLILFSDRIATFRPYREACDFDDMSLEDRVAEFAKHRELDAEKIGEWRDYTLRDWIASTEHVPSWVYFTRFLGLAGKIVALKVGCRAARRALVFWENECSNRSEPREVIEYVEELVKMYEINLKSGNKESVAVRAVRSSAYSLAVYVQNNVAWPMSIPKLARGGADVIERLGIAVGKDDCYCLAEGIMAALISATKVYEPAQVQVGSVYTQPNSDESDRYEQSEKVRQQADFLAVLDECEMPAGG